MPETFTNSKGVEFARPLLRAELSSTTDTTSFLSNNEHWYTGTAIQTCIRTPPARAIGWDCRRWMI
ncbi:DUF823 domain-containing adhesin [Salmonella sp. WGH-01]|nr:DUF823 domain-containing adhesin [Salmonella sp. WGH-01]